MNNFIQRKSNLIILGVFLLQLVSLAFPVINYNHLLNTGETYTIEVEGYDPYDVLRGRYLSISILDNVVSVKETLKWEDYKNTDPIYIVLQKNQKAPDTFAYATVKKPAKEDYIKVNDWAHYGEDDKVRFYPGIDKYYVNEKLAPILETKLRGPGVKAYINIVVKNGKYLLKNIMIDSETF